MVPLWVLRRNELLFTHNLGCVTVAQPALATSYTTAGKIMLNSSLSDNVLSEVSLRGVSRWFRHSFTQFCAQPPQGCAGGGITE